MASQHYLKPWMHVVDPDIGMRIRFLRKNAGVTMIEMAHIIEISKASLGEIENGRQVPNIVLLKRICQVLQCKSEQILGF